MAGHRKSFVTALAAGASFISQSSAQDMGFGVPLPQPMDMVFGMSPSSGTSGTVGSCGRRHGTNMHRDIQAVYAAADRCDEFDPRSIQDYREATDYRRRSVEGYFAFIGADWYAGQTVASPSQFARKGRASEANLTFVVDESERERVERDFLTKVRANSAVDAEMLDEAGLFQLMGGALRPYGLSTEDLSHTTSVYMIELWDAANGASTDLTRSTAQTLAGQVADAYRQGADPSLANEALRQEQSDTFLLHAYLITSLKKTYQQPNTNPREAAAFQSAMRDLGQEVFGIDLTKATINERGLTPGEVLSALDETVRGERASRAAADTGGGAERTVEAALGRPCGHAPSDTTERKVLQLFETKGICGQYDAQRYAEFRDEVSSEQHYAVNYLAWSMNRPLYPADQAEIMDGMIE